MVQQPNSKGQQPNRGDFGVYDTATLANGGEAKTGEKKEEKAATGDNAALGICVSHQTAMVAMGFKRIGNFAQAELVKFAKRGDDENILEFKRKPEPAAAFAGRVPKVLEIKEGENKGQKIIRNIVIKGVDHYAAVLSSTSKIPVPKETKAARRRSTDRAEKGRKDIETEMRHVRTIGFSFPSVLVTPNGDPIRPSKKKKEDDPDPKSKGKGATDFLVLCLFVFTDPRFIRKECQNIVIGFLTPSGTYISIKEEAFDKNTIEGGEESFMKNRRIIKASSLQPESWDEELFVNKQEIIAGFTNKELVIPEYFFLDI